jgi:HD-GYP domain-containing protein (c-di-GMP phosphodiesterase class II)
MGARARSLCSRRVDRFGLRPLREIAPIVRHHHERFDGQGYPDGLEGDAIPLEARIVAAADTYAAITTDRGYRPARSSDEGLDELRRATGKQLDPRVVHGLLELLEARPAVVDAHLRAA